MHSTRLKWTLGLAAVALAAGLLFLPVRPAASTTSAYLPPQAAAGSASPARFVTVADTANPPGNPASPANTVNASMSNQAIESVLVQAPRGANILFAAGTYNITSTLNIPCNDLHIAGPAASVPTAILAAAFTGNDIFAFQTGCVALGSIKYLHFENTGAVYVSGGNNSNFRFENNLVTNLPSGLGNGASESALYFDGSLETSLSNVLIRHNTFGDAQSCKTVFASPKDEGGYCSGIITAQGEINNIRIEYNNFFHLENGIHFLQLAQWEPGKPNSVCISCAVEYNYIANYHRIGIEIQVSTPTNPILIQHNSIVDPILSSWGTFAVSMACCQWSRILGTLGYAPGYIFNDNVLVATLPIGAECPPYGVEFWGHGSQGLNSLVQGTFCNGYIWGFGAEPWTIQHNYICGPNYVSKGGYIADQQHQGNPPKQSDNLVAASCSATPSTAPTISPAAGSFTGSRVVTLADPGLNTGIWYTTDGTAPVPGSGTAKYYTEPFSISGNTTVKAVGMWGTVNQPVSYPTGYGYVPSRVISATYTVASA